MQGQRAELLGILHRRLHSGRGITSVGEAILEVFGEAIFEVFEALLDGIDCGEPF